MIELPTIDLVVAVIGDDRSCGRGLRPYILIHVDGRVYRAAAKQSLSLYENGEVVTFYTEGDDEPFAPTLRYFEMIQFVGEAKEDPEINAIWQQILARTG